VCIGKIGENQIKEYRESKKNGENRCENIEHTLSQQNLILKS